MSWLLVAAIVLSALTPRMHGMDLPKWMTLGQGDLCTTQPTPRSQPAQDEGKGSHASCVCLQCAVHTPGDLPPGSTAFDLPILVAGWVQPVVSTSVAARVPVYQPAQPRAPPFRA
ncbi:MAG: hypothetical protein JO142_09725 [Burkholderiales bacterium]|nr:hypothetical protein [Burkholderiales bacterium]